MTPDAAELDPRIERSRRIVLRAALEELGDVGYGRFAVERVAARAGVAKSTIYRLWRGKLALIADAFQTFHRGDAPTLSGSARERLTQILQHVAEVVSDPVFSACFPALIEAAERDAALRAFHHQFQAEARRPLVAVIAEVARELGRDERLAEPAAAALLGAIFYRRLMTAGPFSPEEAEDLVAAWIGVA